MAAFLCKLIAPRPTFPFDMSDAERGVMERHGAYLQGLADRGKVIVFGPVADPAGPWGLAVFNVADEAELKAMLADDPAAKAEIGLKYETLPMLAALTGTAVQQQANPA